MQQENKPIIQSIREFVLGCPFLKERQLNVDFLDGQEAYSIEPVKEETVLRQYTDGGSVRQYMFVLESREKFDGNVETAVANREFYEKFAAWLDEQSSNGSLPILSLPNMTALSIGAVKSSEIIKEEEQTAVYRIECSFKYSQQV